MEMGVVVCRVGEGGDERKEGMEGEWIGREVSEGPVRSGPSPRSDGSVGETKRGVKKHGIEKDFITNVWEI